MAQSIFVSFTDASESSVAGYYSCEQPATSCPYQGTIETSDSRWVAWCSAWPFGTSAGMWPAPNS